MTSFNLADSFEPTAEVGPDRLVLAGDVRRTDAPLDARATRASRRVDAGERVHVAAALAPTAVTP